MGWCRRTFRRRSWVIFMTFLLLGLWLFIRTNNHQDRNSYKNTLYDGFMTAEMVINTDSEKKLPPRRNGASMVAERAVKLPPRRNGASVVAERGVKFDNNAFTSNCSNVTKQLQGRLEVNHQQVINLTAVQTMFPDVGLGGTWRPRCGNPDRVAIIIPFMDKTGDRTFNLGHLILHLHTILQRHHKEYIIVVVKQNNSQDFINKGVLMNLGFEYVSKRLKQSYECIIFNDVDLVPVDDKTDYKCMDQPLHLSSRIDGNRVTFKLATGGVLSVPARIFEQINGFSLRFWGWGNEDDDLASRIKREEFEILPADVEQVDFIHMPHRRSYASTNYRPEPTEYKRTGLNTLYKEVTFKLLSLKKQPLNTLLTYYIAPSAQPHRD